VQNGQTTALATVQQLDPIYVDVTQSSNDFLRLKQELANGTLKQENGKAKVELVTNDGIKYPQAVRWSFLTSPSIRPPVLSPARYFPEPGSHPAARDVRPSGRRD
jgi:multidrug efflux pump subunit AcrA (membrane-fusion protein)